VTTLVKAKATGKFAGDNTGKGESMVVKWEEICR
jgi:hypothetical protein